MTELTRRSLFAGSGAVVATAIVAPAIKVIEMVSAPALAAPAVPVRSLTDIINATLRSRGDKLAQHLMENNALLGKINQEPLSYWENNT